MNQSLRELPWKRPHYLPLYFPGPERSRCHGSVFARETMSWVFWPLALTAALQVLAALVMATAHRRRLAISA